jgi:hypothetical protein
MKKDKRCRGGSFRLSWKPFDEFFEELISDVDFAVTGKRPETDSQPILTTNKENKQHEIHCSK